MDNSFIRLKPSFNQAKQMFDSKVANKRYYDCISLHPNETYLQITNSDTDIVFGNSYKASIIDCNEKELKDITDNVSIYEGTDSNGIRQIAFEIVNIGKSWYGNPVFLKLESTIGSDVFYSNAFTVSDENTKETIKSKRAPTTGVVPPSLLYSVVVLSLCSCANTTSARTNGELTPALGTPGILEFGR